MKTLLSVFEILLAVPLSILAVPLLIAVFVLKAIRGRPATGGIVIRMDTSHRLSRNAG